MNYDEFIAGKSQLGGSYGFEPLWMPDFLFDFQKYGVDWMTRMGRGAGFYNCGLGKAPMNLVCAENVVRKTNGRFIIFMPLAVCDQMQSEGEKFGVETAICQDGRLPKSKIILTNYERLHNFNPNDFEGAACDESSCLKDFSSTTRNEIIDFMSSLKYRHLWTATPSPNDYMELGNSSECLGVMKRVEMLGMFFTHDGSDTAKWCIKGHAQNVFWRWVCSWARACRKPSDLGFDDSKFILPELIERQFIVDPRTSNRDFIIEVSAVTLDEQRAERRRTINERCEKAAELHNAHQGQSVAWCGLNDEGDLLERLIPNCVQVAGKDSDEEKLEKFKAFRTGQAKTMVTKAEIASLGLNWQFADYMTYFPSHSFESWFQCVRRLWRFGQTKPVTVDVITSPAESRVIFNQQRKARAADEMFEKLVKFMNDELKSGPENKSILKTKTPNWLNKN